MDAELQFNIEVSTKGRDIFNLVCQTIGLREHWYFGLKYLDKSNEWTWLTMNKTILSQPVQIQQQQQPTFLSKQTQQSHPSPSAVSHNDHSIFTTLPLTKLPTHPDSLGLTTNILPQQQKQQTSTLTKKKTSTLISFPSPSTSSTQHLIGSRPLPPCQSNSTLSLCSTLSNNTTNTTPTVVRGTLELYFVVKYYTEDITNELIQDITRHLFYLQVKHDILNMDIYTPPDTAAHLASLSLQAKFGDYEGVSTYSSNENVSSTSKSNDVSVVLEEEALLPPSCFQKIELSKHDWFERIVSLWKNHQGLTREEAECQYLKHAQDLDMFGLSFFEISKIQNKKESDLWLGIDSLGIRFYKKNKLRPDVFFSWSDIKYVTANDKKVILNMVGDKHSNFAFFSNKSSVSKEILDLANGNHELYMRRRQDQPIEIQQMKYFEQQQQKEKLKTFTRERELRLAAEKKRQEVERQFIDYQKQMKQTQDTLLRYQEAAELLARKAQISGEEARLQAEKALEIESELERCKFEISRNEEEKLLFARQINECEQVISTLVNDSVKNRKEAEELKHEVSKWRIAEQAAREKLIQVTQLNQTIAASQASQSAQHTATVNQNHLRTHQTTLPPPQYRPPMDQTTSKQTDSSPADERAYLVDKQNKQHLIQQQLLDLKNVIQQRKIEDKQSPLDKAYEENLAYGDNKYSTIQK
ncbi:unnamed protein product, partial [Didymodactylos carnosus]